MDRPVNTLKATPPCARYEGGENDERLNRVWIFVAGLIGGGANAEELGHKVARLYDYKGLLVVATRENIPQYVEELFRHAWAKIGWEPDDQVEFVDVNSDRWASLWASRRFDSDWRH